MVCGAGVAGVLLSLKSLLLHAEGMEIDAQPLNTRMTPISSWKLHTVFM